MLTFLSQLAIASCWLLTIPAIPTISVKGAKFFADGQQFFLKGVAYQGTPADPLVDTAQCTSDAESMAVIGTNSIRVYHVDPSQNHDGCMSIFEEKGIYVWLDLDTFTTAITQENPTWEEWQFGNFSEVMDAFQKYENVAGFWVGNEVINTVDGSVAAPYIKAAAADMKAYMAAKNYRTIPIGYSAADIAQLRPELQNYLACGDDYSQSIDFYGLNSYEWCGNATYQTSGYRNLQAIAEGYSIPIFFSETGCNVAPPRTFTDQAAIFGSDMINTWSGAIIYEWVEETNHYGLVTYPNGQIYSGSPIHIQPDYDNLAGQWKNINLTGVPEGSYSPSFSAPTCPGPTSGWLVNGNVPLPTLGSAIVKAEAASIKPTPIPSTTFISNPSSSESDSTTESQTYSGASLSKRSLHLKDSFALDPASDFTRETTTIHMVEQSSLSQTGTSASLPASLSGTSSSHSSSSSYSPSVITITSTIDNRATTTTTVKPLHTMEQRSASIAAVDIGTSRKPMFSTSTTTSYSWMTNLPKVVAISLTAAGDATSTSSSPPSLQSKGGKGAGSTLEIPAGIVGGILAVAMLVFG